MAPRLKALRFWAKKKKQKKDQKATNAVSSSSSQAEPLPGAPSPCLGAKLPTCVVGSDLANPKAAIDTALVAAEVCRVAPGKSLKSTSGAAIRPDVNPAYSAYSAPADPAWAAVVAAAQDPAKAKAEALEVGGGTSAEGAVDDDDDDDDDDDTEAAQRRWRRRAEREEQERLDFFQML